MDYLNTSILIHEGSEPEIKREPSPKDIISVNGVRLGKESMTTLEKRANSSGLTVQDYIESANPFTRKILKDLRANEPITFESENVVVVPHGNAKTIAPKDGKAFIVSRMDQSEFSLDFFHAASGLELQEFFYAAAATCKQNNIPLDNMFAVMHIRGKNNEHSVSPQKYPHIHLTNKNSLNPELRDARTWVPHPKKEGLALLGGGFLNNFKWVTMHLTPEKKESALHRVIYFRKTNAPQKSGPKLTDVTNGYPEEAPAKVDSALIDMFAQGHTQDWEDWRDTLFDDRDIINAAENGGIRLIVENGLMHVHGGEPLYGDGEKRRWTQLPPSP